MYTSVNAFVVCAWEEPIHKQKHTLVAIVCEQLTQSDSTQQS